MKRRATFMAAALLLGVLFAACSQPQSSDSGPGAGLRVGQPAPDFSLPSASRGRVSLSDFEGKPVLLYFSMGPG